MARRAAVLATIAVTVVAVGACTPRAGSPGDVVEVSGRIAYVEAVDPDRDGDAHFVLLDRGGITAPGITIVDVRRDLRPQPLPGIGDRLTATGPIRTGSFGQRQVEATRVTVATR